MLPKAPSLKSSYVTKATLWLASNMAFKTEITLDIEFFFKLPKLKI